MSQQQHHRASSGHHPTQQQQQHPHMSSRNLMQYPTAPTAAPGSAASTDPTRPNPTALASSSGVILHQPYPNSVGIHPVQLQYTHHHQTAHSHRPTQSSSSSAAAPPPPIPTHTRPVDMPASPTRPGSTHYAVSLRLLASAPLISVEHRWNVARPVLALAVLPPTIDDTGSLHAFHPSYTPRPRPRPRLVVRRTVLKLPRPPEVVPSEREQMPISEL